jgi:hypothetical protein
MLVHFIRHLPELSEPELEAMAALNPVSPAQVRQQILDEQSLNSGAEPPGAKAPPASPHKH